MRGRVATWTVIGMSGLGLATFLALITPSVDAATTTSKSANAGRSHLGRVCKLLTKAEIASATHTAVGNPTEKNNVHGSVYGVFNECNFPGNHDAEFVQLLLYHGTQTTSGLASAAANQGGCSRVSRVGDAAYFCTGKVMLTLKGSTELDVDGSAGVSKSALVKLAKIAVGRL